MYQQSTSHDDRADKSQVVLRRAAQYAKLVFMLATGRPVNIRADADSHFFRSGDPLYLCRPVIQR